MLPTWTGPMGSLCMAEASHIALVGSLLIYMSIPGHPPGSNFDSIWHLLNRMSLHYNGVIQFNYKVALTYYRIILFSFVKCNDVALCFSDEGPSPPCRKEKKRGSIGPFNSRHTGLISFRAHYRVERSYSLFRRIQVMRHLKYSTTLG